MAGVGDFAGVDGGLFYIRLWEKVLVGVTAHERYGSESGGSREQRGWRDRDSL